MSLITFSFTLVVIGDCSRMSSDLSSWSFAGGLFIVVCIAVVVVEYESVCDIKRVCSGGLVVFGVIAMVFEHEAVSDFGGLVTEELLIIGVVAMIVEYEAVSDVRGKPYSMVVIIVVVGKLSDAVPHVAIVPILCGKQSGFELAWRKRNEISEFFWGFSQDGKVSLAEYVCLVLGDGNWRKREFFDVSPWNLVGR
jgi:hypothetical protein